MVCQNLVRQEQEMTYRQCLELPIQHPLRFEEISLVETLVHTG